MRLMHGAGSVVTRAAVVAYLGVSVITCTSQPACGQSRSLAASGRTVAPDGYTAGAPTCGDPACEYLNDSGVNDNAIGLNPGAFAWFSYFEAEPGCDIIRCIRVIFGPTNTPAPNTDTIGLFIYNDVDTDPSTIAGGFDLLWSGSGIVAAENTNTWVEYATDPTPVNGGFWIGVVGPATGEFPAGIDQTIPGTDRNWTAFNLTNPANPLDSPGTVNTIFNVGGAGLDGTWTLRAVGAPALPPCGGDTNGDHTVNVNDLNNVILDWGTDGSGNGGDIADNVGDPVPDGSVDVNDLNAVIVGWGDCDLVNDDCADSVIVGGAIWHDTTDGFTDFHSIGATLDATAPPFSCGNAANDVWFDYVTPPDLLDSGGQLHLATCGSTYDTIIEVYAGHACPPDQGDSLLCIDDGGSTIAGDCTGTLQGSGTVSFLGNNQPLKIRIGGWTDDAEGWGRLNLVWESGGGGVPPGDDCESTIGDPAFELVAGGQTLVGQTVTANADPQAFPCGLPPQAPGVWFWFDGDGQETTIALDCLETDFDSILNVYCWNGDCDAMLCIGGDDDGCGMLGDGVPSIFTFCTTPGTRYAVLVNGSGGAIGSFEISRTVSGACGDPKGCVIVDNFNDTCALYSPIGDGIEPFSTQESLIAPDGPDNAGFDCNDFGSTQTWSDIWFCYEVDAMGAPEAQLVVSTCEDFVYDGMAGSADYDTDLVLYGPFADNAAIVAACEGGTLNDSHVACNDDEPTQSCGTTLFHSFIRTPVNDAALYLIRVGGWGEGNFGTGQLLVKCLPANDKTCEFGEDLGVPADDGSTTWLVDTTGASVDIFPLGPPPCATAPVAPGRWARVTGNGNTYDWELCAVPAFSFATRTTVFCGPCDDLECFDEPTDGSSCDPFTEAGSFCSKDADVYYFLVHGEAPGVTGQALLTVTDSGMPCNDPPCQPCVTVASCVGDADEAVASANNVNPETCRIDGDDDLNGGCNVAIPAFGVSIPSLPYTICGTTSTYVDSTAMAVRDTDWHRWVSDGSAVTWDVTADFLAHGILGEISGAGGIPDCVTVTVIQGQFGLGDCLPNGISSDATLVAGDIALCFASIQTAAFGGQDLACTDESGGAYTATLSGP